MLEFFCALNLYLKSKLIFEFGTEIKKTEIKKNRIGEASPPSSPIAF
jgi:hypothetical protein